MVFHWPIVCNKGSAWQSFVVIVKRRKFIICQELCHFVEKNCNASIHSNQMVSLDVVSLFTRVTIYDTLTVVRDKLAANPSLEECTFIWWICFLYGNDLLSDSVCHILTRRRTNYGITFVPGIGQRIHGILRRNGFRIYVT